MDRPRPSMSGMDVRMSFQDNDLLHRRTSNEATQDGGKKRNGSRWVDSSTRNDTGYEEGEEFEMLLDPANPDAEVAGFDDDDDKEGGSSLKKEVEDSPYEEVRAAVKNVDEDLPCNTVRAWTIGLTLVVFGASANTLFSLRSPSIGLGPLVAQIIAWPIGQAWERWMPVRHMRTFGLSWELNPGSVGKSASQSGQDQARVGCIFSLEDC